MSQNRPMGGFYGYAEVRWQEVADPDSFPFSLPAVKKMGRLLLHPKCTFFIGENGAGKSTILEAIAVAVGFSAEGGARGHKFKTFDSHSPLHGHLFVKRGLSRPADDFFLRAETLYNVASYVADAGGPRFGDLHYHSHGETFLEIVKGLRGHGLYLMDEPESALSPQRQLAFLMRMDELIRDGSQFIIATHSPIILAYPDSLLYEFTADGITPTTYEETEHFRITKDFLNSRSSFLRHIVQP